MANSEHLDVVKRGRYIWNQWRADHPEVKPDLRGAYLREADLSEYDLVDVDLRAAMVLGGDLSGADLSGADLSFADLRFVDFSGAKLEGARFHESKGVPAWVVASTRGAGPWRRLAPRAAGAAALLAGGWFLLQSGLLGRTLPGWTAEASQLVESWVGGEGEEEASDDGPSAGLASKVREIEQRLTAIEFSTWRIERVLLRGDGMVVRTDQDELTEAVYLPTLAAACGSLAGREDRWTPARIHVLDSTESAGWTFESPETCGELIRTPPRVMRLAIAADTRNYEPRE